jgi:hypothetical protein
MKDFISIAAATALTALTACGTPNADCDNPTPTEIRMKDGTVTYADPRILGDTPRACPTVPTSDDTTIVVVVDPPIVEPPVPPVDPPKKVKDDNSDANGKGGNKHDRKDKDKPPQEIAEIKKGAS